MNSKRIGNITELECMLAFEKLGYSVLIPYGDCDRYDFVVDINGEFLKIQCKTSKSIDGGNAFTFSCRSSHRFNGKVVHSYYNKEEIDYFMTCFDGVCYLVNVLECGSDKVLRISEPKNNQRKNICMAKDYEVKKVMEEICNNNIN